jgi:hypothetical protein
MIYGETTTGIEEPPVLKMIENKDLVQIRNACFSCLKLQKDQNRNFNCRVKTIHKDFITLNFDTMWVNQYRGDHLVYYFQ